MPYKDKEARRAYAKAWAAANHEKIAVKQHEKYEKNKIKILETRREKYRLSAEYKAEVFSKIRAYRKRYPDKVKKQRKKIAARKVNNLSDSYIKNLIGGKIGLPASCISQEMIQLKREQLSIHRATKKLLTTIKEKQNGTK